MQELVEVVFRSERFGYFINSKNLELQPDMKVIVRVERGENIARVINSAFQNEDAEDLPEKPGKILRIRHCGNDLCRPTAVFYDYTII